MLSNFEFQSPEFFWLFLLLPVVAVWYFFKRNKLTAQVKLSSLKGFKAGSGLLAKFRPVLFVLRLLALACLITALARPRNVDVSTRTNTTRGIDIVIAIDVSASMLARDLKPNRLEALKEVASQFIADRPSDRIGLVEYAGESYTRTPITSDKSIVLSSLNDIQYNSIIEGGTASELAQEFGIKVYTIGLGTNGTALSPVALRPDGSFQYGSIPVEIDEALLQEIADKTGGLYFRATDNESLEEIYAEINKLEKTDVEEFKYTNYEEKFRPLVILAGLLLLFELLLRYTVFRSFV